MRASRRFFSQFGAVEEALVMREAPVGRSRGFGFVTFKDAGVAEKILTQDLELDGRKLDMKKAVPKMDMIQQPPPLVDPTPSNKKLYVAGISFDATEDQLIQFFSRYGQVEKANVMKDKQTSRSRGFGFVSFVDEGVVQDILNQHNATKLEWEGRTLDLKAAVPKGASVLSSYGGSHVPVVRNKKLYIAGLLQSTTDESLHAYFSKFGTVAEATIQKNHGTGESRGFGFVTFQDVGSVERVLEQSHMLDNQPIDCKVAVPKMQQAVFPMGVAASIGNNYASAWNTPATQHYSMSASPAVGSTFARAGLDIRDVRNSLVEPERSFGGGYSANQGGGYADRFGATSTAAAASPYGGGGYGGPPSGLAGLGGASRLPSQGTSYGSPSYGGVGGGFDSSYEHTGARATYAAPSYGRDSNYYSEESSYGGYDRQQRPRVAYHPYSR